MSAKHKEQSMELALALRDTDSWYNQLDQVVKALKRAFTKHKIVYVAGNGGSATLAQHLSDEMVGRYKENRAAYPVVALTADSAVITCIGNDYGYEQVFSRQIEALGKPGDIFIGYSTSGSSANILAAAKQAKRQKMTIISFTGNKGKLKNLAHIPVISPARSTARIQELDLHAIHLMCEAFEPGTAKKKKKNQIYYG